MHRLLQRQLEKVHLDSAGLPADPAAWQTFLERVSRAYQEADQEQYLHQRALSVSSEEMQKLYDDLRAKSESAILRVKEEAKFSAAHLGAVLDTAGEGILTVKQNGRIMQANAEVQAIWGYSQEELANRHVVDLLDTPFRKQVLEAMRRFNRFGTKDHFGVRHAAYGQRKNGAVFPLEAKITETRVGDLLFFTVAVHDVTQRVQAEKELTVQMRRNELILQQAMDGFYMHTSQGHIREVNRRLCALTGFTREQMLHMTVFDLYEMDPRKMVEILDEVKKTGRTRLEADIHCAKGRLVTVEISLRYGQVEGECFFSVFVRDLTTAKESQFREAELQARLSRSERMESLGVLAGGVAHDLNNILGPLVGYPDLLMEDLPADSPAIEMVQEMGVSARRAAAVIQDLLALARRGNYRQTPIDLNDVLMDYLKSPEYRKSQEEHPEVSVETEWDPAILPMMGSAPHLMQVIMNLVANAFEAIDGPGTVTIQTRCRYLDLPVGGYDTIEEGDYVVLRIADTGSGISPENLERIFEPFYTRKMMGRSGTGLGLAVVYGVVKDLHGYIDVVSEEGMGTEFVVYFPVTREAIESHEELNLDLRGDERVLVVDDVEEQRNLAARLLASVGYTVFTVPSGEAALEYLAEHEVDVVVLDMIMEGGIDGLATLTQMRRILPDQRCIIASGFAETDRVKSAMELGIGDYVLKPYTLEKIGRAVRKELNRDVAPTPV